MRARLRLASRWAAVPAMFRWAAAGVAGVFVAGITLFAVLSTSGDEGLALPDPGLWFAVNIPVREPDPDTLRPPSDIRVFSADTSEQFHLGVEAEWVDLEWSPDGRYLYAFTLSMDTESNDVTGAIYLFEPFAGTHREFSIEFELFGAAATWSPDGERIAFAGAPGGVWTMDTSGSRYGPINLYPTADGFGFRGPSVWSPDSRHAAINLGRRVAVFDRDMANATWSDVEEWAPDGSRIADSGPSIFFLEWADDRTLEVYAVGAPPSPEQERADGDREIPGWILRATADATAITWTDAERRSLELIGAMTTPAEPLYEAIPHSNVETQCAACSLQPGSPQVITMLIGDPDGPEPQPPDWAGATPAIATLWQGTYLEIPLDFDPAGLGPSGVHRFGSPLNVSAVVVE